MKDPRQDVADVDVVPAIVAPIVLALVSPMSLDAAVEARILRQQRRLPVDAGEIVSLLSILVVNPLAIDMVESVVPRLR